MKIGILEKIAESMYTFSAYLSEEYQKVTKALVLKHLFLIEPGPGTGWQGWKMSLKFNYRQNAQQAAVKYRSARDKEVHKVEHSKKQKVQNSTFFLINRLDLMKMHQRMWLEEELKKKNVTSSQR